MTQTVNQPSARPTNKVTAGTTGAAVMGLLYWALEAFAPDLPNGEMTASLTPVVVIVLGWFIKDRPNT